MLPNEAAVTVFECPEGFEEVDKDLIEEIHLDEDNSSELKVLLVIPDDGNGGQIKQLLTLEVPSSSNEIQQIGEWIDPPAQLNQKHRRVQSSSKDMVSSEVSNLKGDVLPDDRRSNKIIYLDESMRIVNPRITPIERNSNEERIRIMIAPEFGAQKFLVFQLPKNVECMVDDLLRLLKTQLKGEIESVYLTPDSVCNVDYVVKSSCRKVANMNNSHGNKNNTTTIDLAKDSSTTSGSSFSRWREKGNESNEKKLTDMQHLTLYLRRNAQIILLYPLSPRRGSITITIDDFKCLNKNEYLNDVIVDFYLKYLTLEILSPKDQERTYLFNTYFYTRLSKPIDNHEFPAAFNYSVVKRWTKNVNIFQKDFIIVPVHQNAHWFLVIICYPGLIGTSITRSFSSLPTESQYPCILVFDSFPTLSSIKRSAIVQDLKTYLRCEYAEKMGQNAVFAEDGIVVFYPDLPYQLNTTDCGLYLLQYMESFCKDFIKPNKLNFNFIDLKNWFDKELIKDKRDQLKKLIIRLAISSPVK